VNADVIENYLLNKMHMLKTLYLFFLAAISFPALCKDVMTVGWEPSPPFQWQAEDGSLKGLDIDMVRAVLNHAGYTVKFKRMEWNRLLNKGLRNGEIDIALGATKTANREKFAYFSDLPYILWDNVMLIQKIREKEFSHIKKLSHIVDQDITLGVARSTIYSNDYEQLLNSSAFRKHLFFVAKEEHAFDLLLSHEVDAILTSGIHLQPEGPLNPNLVVQMYLNNDTESTGSHFMLSKYSVAPIDLVRINKSVSELQTNQTLKKILKQYALQLYKASRLTDSTEKRPATVN